MQTQTSVAALSALLSAAIFTPAASDAAVLTGSVTTGVTGSVDLTAIGTTNWAVWNFTSSNTGTTLAPSTRLNGGPTIGNAGYISAIARVGTPGGTVRGGNASLLSFNYTNGDAPTSGTGTSGMVFASTLDAVNQGSSLSITGAVGQIYQVSVWAGGFAGQGTLTASLANASNVTLLSQVYNITDSGAGVKGATLFTFNFQPDNASDTLNLSYVLSTDTASTANSHVGISAVAVSVVPEPSSITALSAGLALLALRRRRA